MPWKKYSDVFWNVVKQCCRICQILPGTHDEVVDGLSRLNCVKAFAKEGFVVVEFHEFVVVGFRSGSDVENELFNLNEDAVVDFRYEAKRVVGKLEMQRAKPIYFTGYDEAGIVAMYAASREFVSGVITFGLPEDDYGKVGLEPEFFLEGVYSFQFPGEGEIESLDEHRIVFSDDLLSGISDKLKGIEKYCAAVNRAAMKNWRPEERFELDELLDDLVGGGESGKTRIKRFDDSDVVSPVSFDPARLLKSPLKIVVYYHKEDAESAQPYVDSLRLLFDGFANEHEGYLAGASGLPGVLRVVTKAPCSEERISAYFNDSLHTVLFILVDDALREDAKSMHWLESASRFANDNEEHLVFPVGMYDRAFQDANDFKNFSRIQRASSTSLGEEAVRSSYASLLLVHHIYKLLAENLEGENRLTIFLSHTKLDGLPLAGAMWNQIVQLPGNIDHHGFYDAKSLEPGRAWDRQLRNQAGNCVMLVLRTRLYETRPWCREEFITALENDVPIIVVDATNGPGIPREPSGIKSVREAVLPYHRYPVTHVRDGNLIRVLGLALTEGLRQLIFSRDIEQVQDLGLAGSDVTEKFRVNSGVEGLMELCGRLANGVEGEKDYRKLRVLYQGAEISEVQQAAYDRVIQADFPKGKLRSCTRLFDESIHTVRPLSENLSGINVGLSINDVPGRLNLVGWNSPSISASECLNGIDI